MSWAGLRDGYDIAVNEAPHSEPGNDLFGRPAALDA
jgi:hypothetical protein